MTTTAVGMWLAIGLAVYAMGYSRGRASMKASLAKVQRDLEASNHYATDCLRRLRIVEIYAGHLERAAGHYRSTRTAKPTGWRDVLGFASHVRPTRDAIQQAYRAMAKRAHPDHGGSVEAMSRLNAARSEALRELAN